MNHLDSSDDGSLVGRVIQDRFRIVQRIGAGGMGAVYLAEQLPLGRKVALKVLETAADNMGGSKLQFQERFLLEAAAVAKLAHPNTIVLYDYGRTEEGRFYYAMELVEGKTLSQVIRERTYIDPAHSIHIAAQICGSLRDAHEAHLIHRDLKPGNVMLTRRGDDEHFVKVLDFGLVKQVSADSSQELTRSGIVLGSPRYMAPEQIESRAVDHRVDIYALGCVLYHMLAGAPPFMYGSQFETLRAQVDEAPPPLEKRNPWCEASPRLRELVYRCLEKSPDARPQSMAEVARALRECAGELGMSISSMSSTFEAASDTRSGATTRPQRAGAMVQPPASPAMAVQPEPVAAMPAQLAAPAAPAPVKPKSSPLGWILSLALLLIVAVGAGALAFMWPTAEEEDTRPPPIAILPATPDPAPVVRQPVQLVTDPPGAHVRHDDEDLGDTPLILPIPNGERWRLTLALDGYEPRTITVAYGQPAVHVRLSPVPAPQPVETTTTQRPRPRPQPRVDEQQQVRPFEAPRPNPTWGGGPPSENRNPWAQ